MTDIIKDGLESQAFVVELNRENSLMDFPEDEYYAPSEPPELSDAECERLNDLMPTVD